MANRNRTVSLPAIPQPNGRYTHAFTITAAMIATAASAALAANGGNDDATILVADDTLSFRLTLPELPCIVEEVGLCIRDPLQDVSDAAFNVTTATVGDSAVAARWIPATELNLNGTEVLLTSSKNTLADTTLGNTNSEIGGLTVSAGYVQAEVVALRDKNEELADDVRNVQILGTPKRYTSTNYIVVLLTPASGKNLLNIDKGEICVAANILMRSHFA